MNYESNTTQNTEAKSFIADVHEYSDFEERSLNKKACIAAEQQEQERRMADLDGELIRRQNAKLASGFVTDSSKILNQVPAFAAVVKEVMLNAGSSISTAVTETKTSTAELGNKGWEAVRAKVSEASAKVQDVNLTEPIIDARIALINTAINATQLAVDVGHKGSELSRDVSRKGWELGHLGWELAHYGEEKTFQLTQQGRELVHLGEEKTFQLTKQGWELAHLGEEMAFQFTKQTSAVLALSVGRVTKFGDQAFDLVSEVVKQIAKRFAGWIQSTWENAVYNANLSYSVHLAEKERKRRLTSDDESTAILNALAVSSLVKELAPELYRPSEEPSRTYAFALLEEKEQQHRIAQEKLGGNLSEKAHQVANIVKAHQDTIAQPEVKELLPVFTAEQVILPDPMQIFEEPRDLTEELATAKPIQKLQEPAAAESPRTLRAAM